METKNIKYDGKVNYSHTQGHYWVDFDIDETHYHAELQPYATYNSVCIIRKIEDTEDPNNITKSEDKQMVYKRGNLPFKPKQLVLCITDFTENYYDEKIDKENILASILKGNQQ